MRQFWKETLIVAALGLVSGAVVGTIVHWWFNR